MDDDYLVISLPLELDMGSLMFWVCHDVSHMFVENGELFINDMGEFIVFKETERAFLYCPLKQII